MAHKALIDGTAYEISGGKTLVNGTAYSIENGKTLVDGTAYEVGFARLVTVTIKATNDGDHEHDLDLAKVTINGQSYDGSQDVQLTVLTGTIINCTTKDTGTGLLNGIYLNNSFVSETSYNYKVVSNCVIEVAVVKSINHVSPMITITES